jgi:hypothetical protein
VVSNTSESLRESLKGDLEDARAEIDDLNGRLDQEQRFGEQVYPALVDGRLEGDRVGLIALGGLPPDISDDVESTLEPTGATLSEVAVVREPPDIDALADQLVLGGRLLDASREQLLTRSSGRAARLDGVIVVRDAPDELDESEQTDLDRLEAGLLEGIGLAGPPVVGVEQSDTDPSSIQLFNSHDIPTSDSIDFVSGRVAAVFVLLGADGNFGTKDTADQLLPDLLVPTASGR